MKVFGDNNFAKHFSSVKHFFFWCIEQLKLVFFFSRTKHTKRQVNCDEITGSSDAKSQWRDAEVVAASLAKVSI